jgi:hypothetical protein
MSNNQFDTPPSLRSREGGWGDEYMKLKKGKGFRDEAKNQEAKLE